LYRYALICFTVQPLVVVGAFVRLYYIALGMLRAHHASAGRDSQAREEKKAA
jgi:hypothetical protein